MTTLPEYDVPESTARRQVRTELLALVLILIGLTAMVIICFTFDWRVGVFMAGGAATVLGLLLGFER